MPIIILSYISVLLLTSGTVSEGQIGGQVFDAIETDGVWEAFFLLIIALQVGCSIISKGNEKKLAVQKSNFA